MCRRGDGCAFAHSREEVRAPLLSEAEEAQDPVAMTDEFFMYKFKVYWCPIGVQHNWQNCVYAHNYQDASGRLARRDRDLPPARFLGDLNCQRTVGLEHKQWFWDLRPRLCYYYFKGN